MKLLNISVVAISLITLAACTKDVGPNPDLVVKPTGCDTVTFAKHIKPIIDSKCVSCHINGTSSGAPGDFTIFNDLQSKALNGSIKARVIDQLPSVMPQGGPPLPQDQLDLIKCWLEAGAPNN